ncbi:hypothetical protein HF521_018741 [Silurus meridionalis]|uniref:Uncharacterized protein n=1 Tax=Silurus meridionalis TaxID=175797 RepID=A0A8T0BMQ2_SILME|nr:hypothetical protein HF521_018741 [Silurus meridionalis]
MLIFMAGAGLSFSNGIIGLKQPPMESLLWAYCILAGSFVSEGVMLTITICELRRNAQKSGLSFYNYGWQSGCKGHSLPDPRGASITWAQSQCYSTAPPTESGQKIFITPVRAMYQFCLKPRYGFSNKPYIVSLISGVAIFMMGAGLSWYHGSIFTFRRRTRSELWVTRKPGKVTEQDGCVLGIDSYVPKILVWKKHVCGHEHVQEK